MNADYKLGDRAVLMRLSMGLPGQNRQDETLTGAVKIEHGLGAESGRWIKELFPPQALAALKKLDNEARAYHNEVTLPFDMGIGILPAALIMEYGDKMREFKSRREVLQVEFLDGAQQWVEWAAKEHNGTFDARLYPGCIKQADGSLVVDMDLWKSKMSKKFDFGAVPLPVPDGGHFAETVASLLGTDVQAIDAKVQEAAAQASRELLERLRDPVLHLASRLSGLPCPCRRCNGRAAKTEKFHDSLIDNLKEIARLGPKLNVSGDTQIDSFCKEIEGLSAVKPDTLRADKGLRQDLQRKADDLAKRLSAYKL